MTFIKATYTEDQANIEKARLENKFSYLKAGYKLVNITVCLTNGLSSYVSIKKDGEDKNFVFRISNHQNGNRGIEEGTLDIQCQGEDINMMYMYYGDISKDEARLNFLKESLSQFKVGSGAYKATLKQIEKICK